MDLLSSIAKQTHFGENLQFNQKIKYGDFFFGINSRPSITSYNDDISPNNTIMNAIYKKAASQKMVFRWPTDH